MKNILTIIILTICSLTALAQDKTLDEIKALIDDGKYDKIIEQYAPASDGYSAKAVYYIGLAYYQKDDDDDCLAFMNKAIAKDSTAANPFYIKGLTLNALKKYDEAVTSFKKAIALKPEEGDYYAGLGKAYYYLHKDDLAVESLKKATEQKDPPADAYLMIGQIYSEDNQNDKALEAFYVAKQHVVKDTDSYTNALYNIGLYESLKGNYDKAEPALVELLQLSPDDYHAEAKLIQVYYHQKQYDKAKPYKEKLYDAYRKNLLKDAMKDMFCFDQFKWHDKLIEAFERFAEVKDEGDRKHVFYVVNDKGDIEYRIQTEYTIFYKGKPGPKYLLCATKGNTHETYSAGFKEDFAYDDLKKSVIDVLEGNIKPAASSKPDK